MAETATFNLLDEPWVPVLDAAGAPREVSLLELFEQAPQLRMLSGDISTQTFALLRLSLAILHRALADRTPISVEAVVPTVEWFADHWGEEVVPDVRDYLERHRERFYLFHPSQPFFQTPGLHTAKGEVSDLAKIVVDMPDRVPFLTVRSARNLRALSPAEAARWVVHAQSFDTSGIKTGVVGHPRTKGGKVYPEGVAWTGQLGGVHLIGPTLSGTLLLNLWAALPHEVTTDLPPWERPPARLQDLLPGVDLLDASRPAGPVDLYTWQARHILLFGDASGVGGVLLTYGDRFILQQRQNLTKLEPMTLWRHSKPQSAKYKQPIQMTRKHQAGTALWRGLASIIPRERTGDDAGHSAQIIEHGQRLRTSRLLPDGLVHLRAVGVEYGSQESIVDEIVEDSLDLPAAVLSPEQSELRQVALQAVDEAWSGVGLLSNLAANVATASGASGASLDGPRRQAREAGYTALDPLYRSWLRGTLPAHETEPLHAAALWQRTALAALAALGAELITTASDKAWKGYGSGAARMDVARADAIFGAGLAKVFPRARTSEVQRKVSS